VQSLTCEKCLEIKESLDIEPQCETCKNPYLWRVNREVFQIYNLIASRFVYDFHAINLVFDIYCMKLSKDEAVLLLEKLIIIHREMSKSEEELKEEDNKLIASHE
jgi:hypothetical protein